MAVQDKKPYIEVKKARIARAGMQTYTADEVRARGLVPTTDKPFYIEYRPPEVVLKNLEKFNYPFFTNDHAPEDVTKDNWREYAVGTIGGVAAIEVTDKNEIFITNDVVFYDQDAYDDYKAGKVELSAGYDAKSVPVEDAEKVGYDFILVDIPSVNHVALCDRARAGHNARILDAASHKDAEMTIDQIIGGAIKMASIGSLLAIIRNGKVKDKSFALSKTIFDSVAKISTLDDAAVQKEVIGAMSLVSPLGDGKDKDLLVGTITDSFKNAAEALANKDELGKAIDSLYAKCLDADAKAAQSALKDGAEEKPDEKKPGEKSDEKKPGEKEGEGTKDTATIVDAAVQKALSGVTDSIVTSIKKELPELVDACVAKALGTEGSSSSATKPGSTTAMDSQTEDAGDDFDASFLVDNAFGNK